MAKITIEFNDEGVLELEGDLSVTRGDMDSDFTWAVTKLTAKLLLKTCIAQCLGASIEAIQDQFKEEKANDSEH